MYGFSGHFVAKKIPAKAGNAGVPLWKVKQSGTAYLIGFLNFLSTPIGIYFLLNFTTCLPPSQIPHTKSLCSSVKLRLAISPEQLCRLFCSFAVGFIPPLLNFLTNGFPIFFQNRHFLNLLRKCFWPSRGCSSMFSLPLLRLFRKPFFGFQCRYADSGKFAFSRKTSCTVLW
ncbi:hypothetical protein G7K71_04880 [Desulfofundulus sp. TPOSR]|uniref:hypothetical protein n=1 Tax=Desulfofundulus sp. TPOSR TaxID=2714340 RepID=UPI00140CE836|nr:hypothetical protein [Desulfofundulus sp. TPOSR]NHM26337.1 hypothetical protein [Desulfofundulus sp. TPOSR]